MYHQYIWITTASTKMMMEATMGLGQRKYKVATKYFVFLEVGFPWRGHLKLWWMLVLTLLVWLKPNTKGFWYDTINNMTKDFPVGSYLVFNSKHQPIPRHHWLAIKHQVRTYWTILCNIIDGIIPKPLSNGFSPN